MSMTARPPALGKLDLEQGVLAVDYVQVSLPIWCSAVTTQSSKIRWNHDVIGPVGF
jgi:hypothetical protein